MNNKYVIIGRYLNKVLFYLKNKQKIQKLSYQTIYYTIVKSNMELKNIQFTNK